MTMRQLATKIAKIEGKKSQARIGDIREILGILSDLLYEQFTENSWKIDPSAVGAIDVSLYLNGKRRARGNK